MSLDCELHWMGQMAWAVPAYDATAVNAAGKKLAQRTFPMEADEVLQIVNNWRSSHAFPLNTFQNGLRRRAADLESDIIVAQRIKRLESIHAKLCRAQTDTMRLSQMQDIGGCRVVFHNIESVWALVDKYKKRGFTHKLRGEKNYIAAPKPDGYRGVHLIYEYKKVCPSVYDGLKVELQVRTRLQHAWATAVEAVGIFTRQALKANEGDEDWRRFFALMSSAIAAIEGTTSVPGTPTDKIRLTAEIQNLALKLGVQDKLSSYVTTIGWAKTIKRAKYYVISLDFDSREIKAYTFSTKQSQRANIMYTSLERQLTDQSNVNIVLVSVDSIAALQRAYPNYFLDTRAFQDVVAMVLRGEYPDPLAPRDAESGNEM